MINRLQWKCWNGSWKNGMKYQPVGENRYNLLMENLSAKRNSLDLKIKTYLEKKLNF